MLPTLRDAPNLNYLFAGLVVEELIRNGVEWFVVCPGSRSAPLAWAVASHPKAKSVVHHDERGAAFHALGIAKGTGKPAAFICTSGTAVANALPAVVEASQSGVPLILLTADRPPRLQDTGANQTINQIGIYREFVRLERRFVVDTENFDVDEVLPTIDVAYSRATSPWPWPGPVHLNCMMDEPLAPEPPAGGTPDWSRHLGVISSWIRSSAPLQYLTADSYSIDPAGEERALRAISAASRGLVILGQLSPFDVDKMLAVLERLRWPVIPDVTSGLRLSAISPHCLHYGIHSAEKLVTAADVLLHLGGPITSRRTLDAVSRYKGEYLRVSPAKGGLDPYRNVTLRLVADLTTFGRLLAAAPVPVARSEWRAEASGPEQAIANAIQEAFADADAVSEPSVAYFVSCPQIGSRTVFLGSSMPIRDMDLFGRAGPGWLRVEANRGASGIDGNIATAAGIARATGNPVTAVIGDLAALHDLNSLALVRDLQTPFVLVVQNNDGGGIFSLLPIAKHKEHFEKFFGTPHGLEFEHAAKMYGLRYRRPSTNGEFAAMFGGALAHEGATLIEVRTDRERNVVVHRELDEKIRAALDKLREP